MPSIERKTMDPHQGRVLPYSELDCWVRDGFHAVPQAAVETVHSTWILPIVDKINQ